jgi:hypothetical protein
MDLDTHVAVPLGTSVGATLVGTPGMTGLEVVGATVGVMVTVE